MGRAVHPHIITTDSALGGLEIQHSVRFDKSSNHYFTRTPSSAGNRDTYTISCWVKKGSTGINQAIFYAGTTVGSNHNNVDAFLFNSGDYLEFFGEISQSVQYNIRTNRLFRDVSNWYHIVLAVDTTQGTSSNRIKIYVNGVQETSFSTASYMSQNQDRFVNATNLHVIGYTGGGRALDGCMAEYHFIDGLQLDPSYFGFTEPQTGIWRPKKYTYGNYGTNGFYLDFRDSSSTAALGHDRSGNGNNWTPSNFSVAAGAGNDSLEDTPTNNFCTLNPLRRQNDNCTLSDGNLKATGPNESYPGATGTVALSSGKWYYEFVINNKAGSGNPLCGISQNDYVGGGPDRICYTAGGNYISAVPNEPSDPASFAVDDVIGVAIDLDDAAGKIRFYKNGTLQPVLAILNSVKSDLQVSLKGGVFPYVQMYNGDVCTVNFGQQPFSYTPPSGHGKITSNNLLNHTSILDPKKHFDSLVYTGDDKNYRDVIGLDFTPDFVWIKNRDHSAWNLWANSMTGFQNMHYSNSTAYASYDLNGNGFINPDPIRGENGQGGFNLNAQSDRNCNNINDKHVAWCWKGGSPNIETPTSGSVYFPESNNYLDLGSYTDFQFGTGDYTIEMFVYHTLLSGQQTYASDVNGNSAGVYFYKTDTNKLAMYYSGTIAESSSTTIPLRKWVHVVASRSSGTLKLFQDGIEVGSGSDTTNLTATQLNIGDSNGGTSGSMHGYISNVRVLKGTGLYTSNFTVPTSPLTNITNTKFLGCQSHTHAGLASVHPSPFSNNGTNYSSGSQLVGALTIAQTEGEYTHGGPEAIFDGRIGQYGHDVHATATLSSDNYIEWTPTSAISYTSKVEVWCYAANGYNITNYYYLNGGSAQTFTGGGSNFNNQNWITITTGSGTLTSLKIRLTRSGSASFVQWGAVRIDGCILVNNVTGKVVTPTMDDTRSLPPTSKNPFDGEFAIDGKRYLTAAAAGLNGGTLTPIASSINTKAGFSMLIYEGNGTNGANISHGLRETPKIFFIKALDQARNWYTITTAKDGSVDYFYLNLTNALGNSSASAPTSNLIYYTSSQESNNNGEQYILYAYHDVPGYSKIGSYKGNGNANGPYVELGFKPAFVMMKEATDASTNWVIYDNKRGTNTSNPVDLSLYPNLQNTEGDASLDYDFLGKGFKVRTSNGGINGNGNEYIYMAFAETSGDTPYQIETNAR